MDSGRTKPDKDVFLGTADIIAQVKLAQGGAVRRWFGAARLYLLGLCSVFLGLLILTTYWRALPTHRRAIPVPEAHIEAPVAGPVTMGRSDGSATAPAEPVAAPAPKSMPVKVALTHQSGAMWIDGTKVADRKRAWAGHLSPGNHHLAVRVGGHMMRHTFVVEAEPLYIALDPVRQRFVVSSHGPGHRSNRLRGY